MSEYLLGLYEKSMPDTLSIPEKLAIVKECGFDFLELSIDETDAKLARLDWTKEEIAEIVNAVHTSGVAIGSICLSGHRKYALGDPDPAVCLRSMEIMEKAIALAAKLGVRIIQLAGYDVYYKKGTLETAALFAKNLNRSVEIASAEGVMLAFETMETPFLDTVKKGMDWVNKINSPYLQLYPDAGNITNASIVYGTSVAEDLKTGRGHIAAVHLKETVPRVYREVPYGTGHVDFDLIIKTAFELGVRRFLAEFWYVGQENWKRDIQSNCRFLRQFLEK